MVGEQGLMNDLADTNIIIMASEDCFYDLKSPFSFFSRWPSDTDLNSLEILQAGIDNCIPYILTRVPTFLLA